MLKKLTPAQQAWVDALRSGEYKQTTGCLEDDLGFCCLGVACKAAQKAGIRVHLSSVFNKRICGGTLQFQSDVAKWLQLKNTDAGLKLMDSLPPTYITHLNDVHDMTFNELADFIEWNADRLFEE